MPCLLLLINKGQIQMSEKQTNLPQILQTSQQAQSQKSATNTQARSLNRQIYPVSLKDSSIGSLGHAKDKMMLATTNNIKKNKKELSQIQSSQLERSLTKKKVLGERYEQYEIQNRKQIQERLEAIHKKISSELVNVGRSEQGHKFKLFREIIQTKKDIERISRQRRFIRSQNSKHLQYQQPNMSSSNSKLINKYKLYTEVYEPDTLNLQARKFSLRIHKQQQLLLGRCMMRKQREDKKRQLQYQQEIARKKLLRQIMIGKTRNYRYQGPLFANSRVLNSCEPQIQPLAQYQHSKGQNESQQFPSISGTEAQSWKIDKKYSQRTRSQESEWAPVDWKPVSANKLKSSSQTTNLLPIEDQFLLHPMSVKIQQSKSKLASIRKRE